MTPLHKPPLVLLVDDETAIVSVYKTKLENSGYAVITASNGAEGIAAAIEHHPDLILMDFKMPVMDGVEAQRKIRENPATKDIKVAFITAFSSPFNPEVDLRFAKESGAIDIIKKGIGLDELAEKVRSYLSDGS